MNDLDKYKGRQENEEEETKNKYNKQKRAR